MSINRSKSKAQLFRATKVDPIQTENTNDVSSSKSDIEIAVEESNAIAKKVIQAVIDSAKEPTQLIVDYLNKMDSKNQTRIADKIMRELSGLSKYYKETSDRGVVSHVMNDVKPFLNNILKQGYEEHPNRYPSCKFAKIQLLKEIIPNYLEVIRYHPFDENKEEPLPSQIPRPNSR
jgi:hypothetical protein